jgi:hypothetical protein
MAKKRVFYQTHLQWQITYNLFRHQENEVTFCVYSMLHILTLHLVTTVRNHSVVLRVTFHFSNVVKSKNNLGICIIGQIFTAGKYISSVCIERCKKAKIIRVFHRVHTPFDKCILQFSNDSDDPAYILHKNASIKLCYYSSFVKINLCQFLVQQL